MAILEVTDTEVAQRCTCCGRENRHVIDGLQAGIKPDAGNADPGVVRLPSCTCGATEFLMRSGDNEPEHPSPGCFGHLHRLLVDHVHAELVRREKVIPALRDERGKVPATLAHPLSTATRERWFPSGFRLSPPADEAAEANAIKPHNPPITANAPEDAGNEENANG